MSDEIPLRVVTSPPSPTVGGETPATADATGALRVDVVAGSTTTTAAPVTTALSQTALEGSHVFKAVGGTLIEYQVQVDETAPTGRYYLHIIDAASLPTDSTSPTFIRPPITIEHTNGTADQVGDTFGAPITFVHGAIGYLSSTQFLKTIVGAYATYFGEVR